jgi:hypothetical protein
MYLDAPSENSPNNTEPAKMIKLRRKFKAMPIFLNTDFPPPPPLKALVTKNI